MELKEVNNLQNNELESFYIKLVDLRIFCYFFFLFTSNFFFNKIFKFLYFVKVFEQNFTYIYLYNCVSIQHYFLKMLVNVNEVLLCFVELYNFNKNFLYCRSKFFAYKTKFNFILFDKFILKVDLISFFFLDKYNEAYRNFKYNEYVNNHFFIKNQKFKIYFLKRGVKGDFVYDLREHYNISLFQKKICVFFFSADTLGYLMEHNPIILNYVSLNSWGLENFKLKTNSKFSKFIKKLFLRQNILYIKYFFFKIFMRHYRRYLMEE